jgi:phenol/toluene 2-monooxygenase (NADH) P1/A1
MHVDIKTNTIKPLRQTFGHLARRFGDKQATRYQEATYDLQPSVNFHYKPLWDPAFEMYDRRRTALVMKDWYALKDPRQHYYGSYTIARAKWQEAQERQIDFLEKRNLLVNLPEATREAIIHGLVVLRHYEWGANTNNAHVAAYGWGVAITQAAMMNGMDRLGIAQHLSKIGLLIDGNSGKSLTAAKRLWMDAAEWQGVRREVENMFVTRDWFEVFVAQNLVADGLLYPLFFQQLDALLVSVDGSFLSLIADFPLRWYEESGKWVDAVIKVAAAESAANQQLLATWVAKWRAAHQGALATIAARVMGAQAESAMAKVLAGFDARIEKLGIAKGAA